MVAGNPLERRVNRRPLGEIHHMAGKKTLQPLKRKHEQFVSEYLKDFNASQAAVRAGYTGKPNVVGPRLLANVRIQAVIEAKLAKRLERAELTADRVLEEQRRIAFANPQDLFDPSGNLKPLQSLTPEQAASIASVEIIKKNGKTDIVHKIRMCDKLKALEMLAKHFRILEPEGGPQTAIEKLVLVIQPPPRRPDPDRGKG